MLKVRNNSFRVRVGQLWDRGQNGLDLRAKYQPTALLSIEERFFAKSIATQKQPLSSLSPHRYPKHAPQRGQAVSAPFLIQMRDDFRIRGSAKDVPTSAQLRPQVEIVVDLSVQNNLDLAIFASHRLMAASHINNAETSDGQPDTVAYEVSVLIGTAMPNRVCHTVERAPYFRARHCWVNDACYSAHRSF